MFLFPWFGRSNLRRMADLAIDPQLFHQAQKPLHRSRCFNSYTHRPWQPRIKLLHVTATVCQRLFHHLPGRCIEHRQCLLASVQIASYNPHLGLLRSEHCWGQHRTVYSGRREAGVVMTSTGEVGPRTDVSDNPTNRYLRTPSPVLLLRMRASSLKDSTFDDFSNASGAPRNPFPVYPSF